MFYNVNPNFLTDISMLTKYGSYRDYTSEKPLDPYFSAVSIFFLKTA